MSEIHKISAWVRVAFAVIGFLIGFAAGLSATPVVGTILPLLFAVIGGGAGLFLSKAPHNSKEIGISVALLAMMCLAGSVWGIHLRTASGLRCFITLCAEPTEQYADEIKIPTDENDPEVIANLIAIRADLLRISVPQKDRKRLYELVQKDHSKIFGTKTILHEIASPVRKAGFISFANQDPEILKERLRNLGLPVAPDPGAAD